MRLSISRHARERMEQRGVSEQEIIQTISAPEVTRPGNQPNRTVYERKIGKIVCVVTVDDTDPLVIVSAWKRG